MSELPSSKPTGLSDLNWGDGATPEDQTTPGSALRGAGYPEGSEVAHEHINWRWAKHKELFDWLEGKTRIFDSVADLIDDLSTDEIGRYREELVMPGTTSSSQTTNSDAKIDYWCSDGRRVYGIVGQKIKAWDPSDMTTELWSNDTSKDIEEICTDGAYVFTVYSDAGAGTTTVIRYDVDGTNLATLEVDSSDLGSCGGICSDGSILYVAFDDDVYSESISAWSSFSSMTPDSGEDVIALHTAAGKLYVGTDNHRVFCFSRDGSTLDWSTTDSANSTTSMVLAADGLRCYVFSSVKDGAGEITHYLTALSVFDGQTLWGNDDPGAANEGEYLSHDGRFLYLSNDWEVFWICKQTGQTFRGGIADRTHPLATPEFILHMKEASGGADTSADCYKVTAFHVDPTYRKIATDDNVRPIQGWVLAPCHMQ